MMSKSKMCNRPKKQETAQWTKLFENDLKTQEQSEVFVKRMMALAVSSITYLRGIFPEDAYKSRYLEDLCIKVLREDCATPGARKIVKWMMGSFDALHRRYLQVAFIGVHTNPDDPNSIIESYQFKFRYTDQGPQMDILSNKDAEMKVTMEDTKKASVLLTRKLFLLLQNLDILPNDVCLTMKLYYYDDVTPSDYEPPGFKEGVCDTLWFEGMAVHFRVGEVQTPFHTLKVRVAAEQGRVEKLQEGKHLRESERASAETQSTLLEIAAQAGASAPEGLREEDFPSEDESAQFKKPQKTATKRKAGANKLSRRKGMRTEP
ncbi:zebrafish testis-expressed 38 [Osmerus mordax]|uniref:zebrafish testis-expressed 38 n=1 Tax=Osmerus mordax TaxID=8014 RepID=UPI00351069DD